MTTRVSILIVFLTILTQLNGQGVGDGGNTSRFGFPSEIMKRVGSASRPLLSAPSSVLSENAKPMNDRIPGSPFPKPILTKWSSFNMDVDAFHRRIAEFDSAFDQMMGRFGGLGGSVGGFGGLGGFDLNKKRFSELISDGPLPETPSSSSRPDYSARPVPGTGSIVNGSDSVPSRITSPPEPSSVPDQTSGYRRGPRFDRTFSSPPKFGNDDLATPPPAPVPSTPDRPLFRPPTKPYTPPSSPESCASTNPDAMPSVSKYHRQQSRRAPLNDDPQDRQNNPDVPSRETNPYSLTTNTKKSPPSNPYRPSSAGSSPKTDRFNGSAVVSDKLPNSSGTIDIKISGRQIDDERMLQMIKEAKNAITVVFYHTAYETDCRGSITIKESPSKMPMGI